MNSRVIRRTSPDRIARSRRRVSGRRWPRLTSPTSLPKAVCRNSRAAATFSALEAVRKSALAAGMAATVAPGGDSNGYAAHFAVTPPARGSRELGQPNPNHRSAVLSGHSPPWMPPPWQHTPHTGVDRPFARTPGNSRVRPSAAPDRERSAPAAGTAPLAPDSAPYSRCDLAESADRPTAKCGFLAIFADPASPRPVIASL